MDTNLIEPRETIRIGVQRHAAWRFALGFAIPCVIAVLLAAFSLGALVSNRELVGPIEAAQLQRAEGGGLYGSSLVYRPYPYKLELYRLIKPDVAVIGSSRAMQFLGSGFNGSFTNLGGAINEMADGERLVADMLAIHRPKLVLMTLDYWWFNPRRVAEPTPVSEGADIDLSLDNLAAPYRWLLEHETTFAGLLRTMGRRPQTPPRIGLAAVQRAAGFDMDGVYHYGSVLTGEARHGDRKFASTLKRLRNGRKSGKFFTNADFSEEAWNSLQHIDRMFHDAGVEVRYILPPVSNALYRRMQEVGTGLFGALRDHFSQAGIHLYDFTDAAALGSSDCEFVDGLHGGQVTDLRMLRAIAPDLDSGPARGLVRPASDLDGLIAANAGRATLRNEPGPPEIDFLDLGCRKS